MARRKKAKTRPFFLDPTGKDKHFSRVFDCMIESAAYNRLSLPARALLHYMLQKYNNTGETFTCTYTELIKRGFSRARIRAYIRELLQNGFIEITETGRGSSKTIYKYSARWFEL